MSSLVGFKNIEQKLQVFRGFMYYELRVLRVFVYKSVISESLVGLSTGQNILDA